MVNKAKIRLQLFGPPDKDGKVNVRMMIYFDRVHRKYIQTGIRLLPHQWNDKDGCVKVTNTNTAKTDDLLRSMVRDLESYELDLIKKKQNLTPELVDLFYNVKPAQTFNKFIEDEITASTRLKPGTTKMHRMMLRKLNALRSTVPLNEVNYKLIHEFDNYLRSLGLSENTISDNHKNLKRYINIAIRKDILTANPYFKFKFRRQNPTRDFLSEDEVKMIEDAELIKDSKYDRVRDMFLFCCYTGLRYSDMQALKKDNIQYTDDGYEIALHQMVKVPAPVFLPLQLISDGKAEVILLRYMSDNMFVFPRISNQKANDYIKVVAGFAKVTKTLTWHTARHTFGTMLAARYNDPFLIMQLMGHHEIRTSMIYVHQSQAILKQKLKSRVL